MGELSLNRITSLFVLFLLLSNKFFQVSAQQSTITFSVDLGAGLIYFLVIFFFVLNFGTPIARWIYLNYLSKLVEKASKEISKMSKRFSERLSDAGRRVNQSIRNEK